MQSWAISPKWRTLTVLTSHFVGVSSYIDRIYKGQLDTLHQQKLSAVKFS